MSENTPIKPFGLNVLSPKTQQQTQKTVESAIGNLWEPVLNYLKENDNVFSGNVAEEIRKTSVNAFKIGSMMSADSAERRLDTKF